jgi:YVTN family beta-propeller protein
MVYVTNFLSNTVSVIDEKTNSVVATIAVGGGPEVVAVDSKTKKAYVSNYVGGTVSVIDVTAGVATTNTVIATIPVGPGGANPWGMALDPKTGKVYVANYYAETISVIDEETESVIATIPDTGYHPLIMAADSSNGTVYVLNRAMGPGFADGTTTLVIDEQTNTVTGAFNVFPGPRGIAVDQKSGLLYIGSGDPDQAASVAIYQTRPYFNLPEMTSKVARSLAANTNVTWAQDANLLNTLESGNSNLVNLIIAANNGVVSDSPNYFDGDSYVHVLTTADFGPNGTADYWGAIAFINYLNSIKYNGSNHWALPSVSYDESLGYNQIDNAFGKLYYVTLGATAGSTMPSGTFSNVQTGNAGYWFGSEYAPNVNFAWFFSTNWGYQFFTHKDYYNFVWPVSPGPSKCAKH